MPLFLILIFIKICYAINNGTNENGENKDKLVLLHTIYRHGERTPVFIFPNTLYQKQNGYWSEGLGELTKLLNILANCTRRVNLWKFLRKTREFEAFLKVNDDLFEELTEETGMEITYRNLFMVEDLMHIEQKRGYKLDSYEIELDDRIIYANHQMLKFLNGLSVSPYRGIKFDIEIPKVEAGELLNEILTHMQEKEDCLFDETLNENCTEILRRKYYAYSAHDITMAAFFATLGFKHSDYDKDGTVPLASCIMIEQWLRPDSTSYVKIYYMRRNQPSIDITPKISGCEANCSLIDFSQRSEVYLPDPDINTLCDTPIFNAS